MRKVLFGGLFLVLATASASAGDWRDRGDGWGRGGWGGGPPRHHHHGGYGHGGPRFGYGPPPVRCVWREGYWGPRQICRSAW
jgi:hypothetical protein